MILSHVSFIKSSNARSLNLRSIHFVLLHDNRVTQCDRRVFLTCHSIAHSIARPHRDCPHRDPSVNYDR